MPDTESTSGDYTNSDGIGLAGQILAAVILVAGLQSGCDFGRVRVERTMANLSCGELIGGFDSSAWTD
jgi:hypothetical protein